MNVQVLDYSSSSHTNQCKHHRGFNFPSFIYFSLIQIFSISSSTPSTFPAPFPFIPPSVPPSPPPPPSLLDISVRQLNTTQGICRLHAVFAWNDSGPLLCPCCCFVLRRHLSKPCSLTQMSPLYMHCMDILYGFCVMYCKCHHCGKYIAACTNIFNDRNITFQGSQDGSLHVFCIFRCKLFI